ncbi:MAG: HNH endonuclease, partial [Actinomycetes bacterium]
HTLALMTAGRLSEWRATILVKETVCLEAADRRLVDEQLCGGDQPRAETLGDKALGAAAKALAVQFDAASVVARAARAESERCVSIRPAPDTMAYVTALLPMAAGVGVYAALKLAADCAPGEGDDRSRGQRMADTLVERVTGRNPLERPMDLDLRIVLPDATLVGGTSGDRSGVTSSPSGALDEPGVVPGYGPVPGPWVRRLIEEASLDDATRVLVRQLYAGPHGGLVAMASRARTAPAGLADLVQLRDRFCRTLWCDAEARHIDHIVRARDGGRTELANLQGLCERCNYAREAPGFVSRVVSQPAGDPVSRPRGAHEEQPESQPGGPGGGRHVVETTSPTGHTYRSTSQALAGDAVLPSARFEDQWQLPDELDRDAPPPGELDEAGCGDIVLGLDLDTLRELSDVPAVRRLLSLLDAA